MTPPSRGAGRRRFPKPMKVMHNGPYTWVQRWTRWHAKQARVRARREAVDKDLAAFIAAYERRKNTQPRGDERAE